MNFLKLQGDKIFTGYQILSGEHVIVLQPDGKFEAIVKKNEAGEDVEQIKGLLCPGFINAHCHLELSHMQGVVPEKTGLVDFVFKVVTERHYSEEKIVDAISKAEEEMIQNGIVAVGDICNNDITYNQKQKGKLLYYNFIEANGWLPSISQVRFERALKLYETFQKLPPSNKTAIIPHAPYSVSPALWKLITPYFENNTVSIHNQETAYEDEFFEHGSGDFLRMYSKMNIDNSFHVPAKKSSLQSYFSNLTTANSVILVHNTFTKQADIDFVNRHKDAGQLVSFCLCVNANQYIENALPPLELLQKNNCNIVLGTDSLASNYSLNMLDEMKVIQKNFSTVTLPEMLRWSTINGAKALQMDNIIGSFEKGKSPGVIAIDNIKDGRLSPASSSKKII